jgi:hypothetical protein
MDMIALTVGYFVLHAAAVLALWVGAFEIARMAKRRR